MSEPGKSTAAEEGDYIDPVIDAARIELAFIASRLVGQMPATKAAALFAETIFALLHDDLGREGAAKALRIMADEMASGEDAEAPSGHA